MAKVPDINRIFLQPLAVRIFACLVAVFCLVAIATSTATANPSGQCILQADSDPSIPDGSSDLDDSSSVSTENITEGIVPVWRSPKRMTALDPPPPSATETGSGRSIAPPCPPPIA